MRKSNSKGTEVDGKRPDNQRQDVERLEPAPTLQRTELIDDIAVTSASGLHSSSIACRPAT